MSPGISVIDAPRAAVATALRSAGVRDDAIAGWFFVPGRIEVLGKHTDYAGGRSLVAAIDRGFVVAAARRSDDVVRVIDALTGDVVCISDAGAVTDSAPAWATYPRSVVRRCNANFPTARGGADIVFASDLPQAAGLSSSSALVVAVFLALDAVRGISATPAYGASIRSAADLAGYVAAIESGVGTMGGSQDHTAILCSQPGRLVQYSYAPVRYRASVAMPAGYVFAIASSGVRAEKTGAALESYNRLSRMTHRLLEHWHDAGAGSEPTLAAIMDAHPDAAARFDAIVRQRAPQDADELLGRLEQFIAESTRIVPAAVAALACGDIDAFGELCAQSQQLAERALRNQVPETVHLAATARELGAAAASAFGAGFGGSVWALVRESDAEPFTAAWRASYASAFGERSDALFFIARAGRPATAPGC